MTNQIKVVPIAPEVVPNEREVVPKLDDMLDKPNESGVLSRRHDLEPSYRLCEYLPRVGAEIYCPRNPI